MPWQPATIKRFIQAFRTSACTALVQTDAGQGYIKAIGGPDGPHLLACEWIGTQLAYWLGLPTFDFAILNVSDVDEIIFHNGGRALPGPAFITRRESGEQWSGDRSQLQRLVNPEDITRLVIFDTWTLNCDRYSVPAEGTVSRPRQNLGNVFLSEEAPAGQFLLKAIDHTHCFTCGRELSQSLRNIDNIKDSRVFGLFPAFREFLSRDAAREALQRLSALDQTEVAGITSSIPSQWSVPANARQALFDFIVGRAQYVVSTIEKRLWPERNLDFGEETAGSVS